MKKVWLLLLLGALSAAQAKQKDFGLLWIGNSLMNGGWGCWAGWDFVGKVMIDPDSNLNNMAIYSSAIVRGANDLKDQWYADISLDTAWVGSGVAELNEPTGRISYSLSEPYCATLDHYDYIVLQGYFWRDTSYWRIELDTASRYCDLALSRGTKPIFLGAWDLPQFFQLDTAIYDSLYHKYRSRGCLYLPCYQAHQLVWADSADNKPATSWLYGNDPYHHVNYRGACLNTCVYYEVFTGKSSVAITLGQLKAVCNDPTIDSVSVSDLAYLEGKAHLAVVNFYGANNIPHLGTAAVTVSQPVSHRATAPALFNKQGAQLSTNLAGREIQSRPQTAAPRVIIAQDATGKISRMVMPDRAKAR